MSVAVVDQWQLQAGLRLRIVEPEAPAPGDADLRRLFGCRGITRRRRARLRALPRVLATRGDALVGLAAFDRGADDLRVLEMACVPGLGGASTEVVARLVECLELAAMAGGARRIVILPWAVPAGAGLDRLGYTWSGFGRRGLEKQLM